MTVELDLPKGWVRKDLKSIASRITKGSTPTTYGYSFQTAGINFIKVECIKEGKIQLKLIRDFISEDAHQSQSRSKLETNDILFSIAGTIGETCIIKDEDLPANTNQALAIIRGTNDSISPKLLRLQLHSFVNHIKAKARGGAMNNISLEDLKSFDIIIPPIPDQHHIVDKIEELFSELDKGIENLKTAQQQLKIYRQAVLKWAFEGKLTNDNVRDGELPEGWALVKTKDVIDTINNGYTPTREFLFEGHGEIPFIKVYNLNFNGTLNFDKNPTFIPKAIHLKDLKRSVCEPGDVLINIVGPPLGKVSVVPKLFPEWNINQAIVLFKPNDKVISKYISYFLQNPVTINWLEGTSKATAGQWNVKVSTCREIPFPFCSVEQQQRVVDEIEDRLSVCDKMEETINTSLQQAEALRQSILKRAFEGKLVGK